MKSLKLSAEQFAELDWAARRHPDAHIRSRAMAVRAVALGGCREEVARLLPYSAYSIGQWAEAYKERGLAAFAIAPGRGRQSTVDEEEVRSHLRVSPERFGYEESRWTLALLRASCPSLQGMSLRGVLGVVNRLGFHYKQGQPWLHSPDPAYDEKKTPSRPPTRKHGKTPRR